MDSNPLHETCFELAFVLCPIPPDEPSSALLSAESEVSVVAATVGISFNAPSLRLIIEEASLVDQRVVLVSVHPLSVGKVVEDCPDVVRSIRVDEASVRGVGDAVDKLPLKIASVVEENLPVPVHEAVYPLADIDPLFFG